MAPINSIPKKKTERTVVMGVLSFFVFLLNMGVLSFFCFFFENEYYLDSSEIKFEI